MSAVQVFWNPCGKRYKSRFLRVCCTSVLKTLWQKVQVPVFTCLQYKCFETPVAKGTSPGFYVSAVQVFWNPCGNRYKSRFLRVCCTSVLKPLWQKVQVPVFTCLLYKCFENPVAKGTSPGFYVSAVQVFWIPCGKSYKFRFLRVCSTSVLKPLWQKVQVPVFTCLQYKSFRNALGKEEIAHIPELFFLSRQCLTTLFENFLSFSSNLKLSSANCFCLLESKICRLGKTNTLESNVKYPIRRTGRGHTKQPKGKGKSFIS